MIVAPLSGVSTLTGPTPHLGAHGVLLLAVSRSAAVRLAPIARALGEHGVAQAVAGPPVGGEPQTRAAAAIAPDQAYVAVEQALERARPAFVLVAGDGEAAMAAALAAESHGVALARVGAGLRCGDRGIEGEVNRMALDALAERLYADGSAAVGQLRGEGVEEGRIVDAGSTLPGAVARWRLAAGTSHVRQGLGLEHGGYALATLHKPELLRDAGRLSCACEALGVLARRIPVVFCVHPRTRAALDRTGDLRRLAAAGVRLVGDLAYPDFLALEDGAAFVVTDSSGVQEETSVLGVPCFTLARTSERTRTLTHGTNALLGDDPAEIAAIELGARRAAVAIPRRDGAAALRIAADLAAWSGA
jgi:UDP-N-acetylglucosamine 2-epimerase (non-hydrolysing)